MDYDRIIRSQLTFGTATGQVSVANEKLIIQSQPVPANKYWLITFVTVFASLGSTAWNLSASGIYLCGSGTANVEAAAGPPGPPPLFAARPIDIRDTASSGAGFSDFAGTTTLATMNSKAGPFIIPQAGFLRAIIGNAGPNFNGPGIGSTGVMTFQYAQLDLCGFGVNP